MNFESLEKRDGSLKENWYIACLASELGSRKPVSREIYDQSLVLFRDEKGKVHCLPNRCLHRNARLSEGVILPGGKLGCPYHGWVYSGDGRVLEVPSRGPGSPPLSLCHRSFPAIEQDGCVWIWMGSQPPPGPPPFRFPSHELSSWNSYFMITDFENEVGNLAENFMDVPHTIFVHKGWFRKQSLRKVPIRVETARGNVLVTYQQPNDEIGFSSYVLNPSGEAMLHTDRFILPNITRVDYTFGRRSGFVITSQITPLSTLKSRVYTEIVYKLAGPRWLSAALRPFLRLYTRQVIGQDVEIMANQAVNLRRDLFAPQQNTEADLIHTEIQELRHLARQGNPSAREIARKEEREIWI